MKFFLNWTMEYIDPGLRALAFAMT